MASRPGRPGPVRNGSSLAPTRGAGAAGRAMSVGASRRRGARSAILNPPQRNTRRAAHRSKPAPPQYEARGALSQPAHRVELYASPLTPACSRVVAMRPAVASRALPTTAARASVRLLCSDSGDSACAPRAYCSSLGCVAAPHRAQCSSRLWLDTARAVTPPLNVAAQRDGRGEAAGAASLGSPSPPPPMRDVVRPRARVRPVPAL